MTRTRLLLGAIILAAIIAAPIAWYLISPLFITRTVDEAFPVVQAAAPETGDALSNAAMSPTPTPQMPDQADDLMQATSVPEMPDQADDLMQATPAPEMPDQTDDLMQATPAPEMPDQTDDLMQAKATPEMSDQTDDLMQAKPTPEMMAEAPTIAVAPQPTAVPNEPKLLRTGEFHPVEHEGMGTAAIYELPNGKRILRLENFEVLNGPDLYIWLSAAVDANNARTILDNHYVELGRLKGNQGNQNYELPADLNVSTFNSVTIWCRRFSVNFATAPLS